jgi:hypothetical protein
LQDPIRLLDDDEIKRRLEQIRARRGYYRAFLDLAGLSARLVREIRFNHLRITPLTREKISRAFARIDSGAVEFVPVRESTHGGPARIVATYRPRPVRVEVIAPLRYAQQALREIGGSRGHSHLALPPLPTRGRILL